MTESSGSPPRPSSILDRLRAPPPRSPALPPAELREKLLGGSMLVLGLFVAAFAAAYVVGHPGFIAVAFFFAVVTACVVLERTYLGASLWRGGVVTSAKIAHDTTIETKHVRSGVHVKTTYAHKVKTTFQDGAGRPWEAHFTTRPQSLDGGLRATHLDLLYVPARGRPSQGVVFLPDGEIYTCAILTPGASLGSFQLRQAAKVLGVIGCLVAAYLFVPEFQAYVMYVYYRVTGGF